MYVGRTASQRLEVSLHLHGTSFEVWHRWMDTLDLLPYGHGAWIATETHIVLHYHWRFAPGLPAEQRLPLRADGLGFRLEWPALDHVRVTDLGTAVLSREREWR